MSDTGAWVGSRMCLSFAIDNKDLLREAAFGQINGRIFEVVAGGGCGLVGLGFWNFLGKTIGVLDEFDLAIL